MILAEFDWGARSWLPVAGGIAALSFLVVGWAYTRATGVPLARASAAILKGLAVAALALCLAEPLFSGTRPRPGSNLFLVVADNSRSLQLSDEGGSRSRGEELKARLAPDSPWMARLGQDFDVRQYAFDTALRPVNRLAESLTFDGPVTALRGVLESLRDRFRGEPVAGMLLLSDGNATDLSGNAYDWSQFPPIYPVIIGRPDKLLDVSLSRVTVGQTNFDAAPVTLTAVVTGQRVDGRKIVVRVLDEAGKEVERREIAQFASDKLHSERFLIRPDKPGLTVYTIHACLAGEERAAEPGGETEEAILANNRRQVVVDRGGGPFRVLYVSGRPNWEFKFLRRGVAEDAEVQLVGLVRIARREPKFSFRGRAGERTNPLFRGFGNENDEQTEQYDEPVLLRFDDQDELRGGFPKSAEDLFRYHAIVLDDLEAGFFSQDQLSLLSQFVSHRGGGLLMLGGKDSFAEGAYQRTPVGDLLPVYLDRSSTVPPAGGWRLSLTREGWIQPWVRVRLTESEELQRLAGMPLLQTANHAHSIKPGASVLAQVEATDGSVWPALAVQPFGRGRVGALLVGDLWRWDLRREDPAQSDLGKAWRQTVRWLIADVPQPVEVTTQTIDASPLPGVQVTVHACDQRFDPLDNATVVVRVQTPDKREVQLAADSSERSPGEYEARFIPRESGVYRATIEVTAADGRDVGRRETAWVVEPDSDEFHQLAPNRELLTKIAEASGGEVIPLERIESFVAGLPNRRIPITEPWTYPLWHQRSMFLFAIACLVGEWGLRRWKGLP